MRPPKFNFIPERQLKEHAQSKSFFYATIISNGQICYGKEYTSVYELDKKFVEFYIDTSKRTLGWRILEGVTELEQLNGARKLEVNNKGMIKCSITGLLRSLAWEKGQSFLKLPIKVYKSPTVGGEIHYVELPDIFADKNEE